LALRLPRSQRGADEAPDHPSHSVLAGLGEVNSVDRRARGGNDVNEEAPGDQDDIMLAGDTALGQAVPWLKWNSGSSSMSSLREGPWVRRTSVSRAWAN